MAYAPPPPPPPPRVRRVHWNLFGANNIEAEVELVRNMERMRNTALAQAANPLRRPLHSLSVPVLRAMLESRLDVLERLVKETEDIEAMIVEKTRSANHARRPLG